MRSDSPPLPPPPAKTFFLTLHMQFFLVVIAFRFASLTTSLDLLAFAAGATRHGLDGLVEAMITKSIAFDIDEKQ